MRPWLCLKRYSAMAMHLFCARSLRFVFTFQVLLVGNRDHGFIAIARQDPILGPLRRRAGPVLTR